MTVEMSKQMTKQSVKKMVGGGGGGAGHTAPRPLTALYYTCIALYTHSNQFSERAHPARTYTRSA